MPPRREEDDDPPAADAEIREVRSRRDRGGYLALIRAVYADRPAPSPHSVRMLESLLRGRSPLARHSERLALLAWEGERPVAGLTAMIHERYTAALGKVVGTIGWLEAIRGRESAVDRLFAAAERWLEARGAVEIRGPVNGLPHYGAGCLENRHGEPPALGMTHNPPWYPALWWQRHWSHAPSRFGYRIDVTSEPVQVAIEGAAARPSDIVLRTMSTGEDVGAFAELRRDCSADDRDRLPIARDEVREMLGPAADAADLGLLWIAESSGAALGCALVTPDASEAGMLRRWGSRVGFAAPVRRAVLWDVGVVPPARRRGVGTALVARVLARLRERGVTDLEILPVTENDDAMRRLLRRFGAEHTKTYLNFSKPLR